MTYAQRSLCALAFVLELVCSTSPALADDANAASAKAANDAFKRGMVHFQLDEYDAAIKEWEDAFRARQVPQFLYNIAQAYRKAKQPDKALSFCRKYLAMEPNTPDRATVERQITAMSQAVEEQKRAAETAPKPEPAPVVTAPTPAPTPPPVAVVQPTTVAAPAAPVVIETRTEAPKKPLVKRGWFWGVIGTSVVVVVAATTLGVVFGTRSHDNATVLTTVRF